MLYDADYSVLRSLFIRLVESQAGGRIEHGEEWLNDAQTLAIKLFLHLTSIQRMVADSVFDGEGVPAVPFVDHASAKVVVRAAFETYLVFFYIYGNRDRSVSEFRHKTWRLAGLADRQKFHASAEQHIAQLADEKRLMMNLKSEIKASPHLGAYNAKQSQRILDGDWRIGKNWADLGKDAGFHKRYFSNVYGYLCGYSHSSYLSALQVGQARSIDDQRYLIELCLGIGLVVMAHFCFSYSTLFSTASATLSADPAAKRIAERWQFGSEDMAMIYDR